MASCTRNLPSGRAWVMVAVSTRPACAGALRTCVPLTQLDAFGSGVALTPVAGAVSRLASVAWEDDPPNQSTNGFQALPDWLVCAPPAAELSAPVVAAAQPADVDVGRSLLRAGPLVCIADAKGSPLSVSPAS